MNVVDHDSPEEVLAAVVEISNRMFPKDTIAGISRLPFDSSVNLFLLVEWTLFVDLPFDRELVGCSGIDDFRSAGIEAMHGRDGGKRWLTDVVTEELGFERSLIGRIKSSWLFFSFLIL